MRYDKTNLDMETKVALMAALLHEPGANVEFTVQTALDLEQESHRAVAEIMRERRLTRAE